MQGWMDCVGGRMMAMVEVFTTLSLGNAIKCVRYRVQCDLNDSKGWIAV